MKVRVVAAILLVALAIAAIFYIINLALKKPEAAAPSPESTSMITIIDGVGRSVDMKLPISRIVTLNSGITELIYAFEGGDKIIGRDALSTYPRHVLEKPVVGSSSYDPYVESILELHPDVVLADDMLYYNQDKLSRLEEAGIKVYIDNPTNISRIRPLIKNLGAILQADEKTEEILEFIDHYEKLVAERVGALTPSQRPSVYIEWWAPWQSFAKGSAGNQIIFDAGGINIAAEINDPAPVLSPEFVIEKNPDVILRMVPSHAKGNITAFMEVRDEILNRPELQTVNAVKNGRVFTYDAVLLEGLRYPVGLLYWAKCLNPELFADIEPEQVLAQLTKTFFGCELEGVYFYPSP